ncbi:MAG TPA: pilus assembly protein TadG-related protein [Candidatus Limnocylindrales bacterium]
MPGRSVIRRRRHPERGQTLVIFAGGVAGLLALIGLVVDGAHAYAQHRAAQNAADAASQAGAAALARAVLLDEVPVDHDVKVSLNAIAVSNHITPFFPFSGDPSIAYYTDVEGVPITVGGGPARVGAGAVPTCSPDRCVNGYASGVQVVAVRPFRALLAGVVGQTTFTARTTATSVAGYLEDPCDADTGCPLLPVALSLYEATCAADGTPTYGAPLTPWTEASVPLVFANEVSIPICREPTTGDVWPGAAVWIDYDCGSLGDQITEPCNDKTKFPTWIPAWDGSTTGLSSPLAGYHGSALGSYEAGKDTVVLAPLFDAMCHEDKGDGHDPRGSGFPLECRSGPASGPVHVRLPKFVAFAFDGYLDGGAISGCNLAPAGGGTSSLAATTRTTRTTTTTTTGPVEACIRGWFADAVLPPGPVGTVPFEDGSPRPLTIQLIQ